MKKVFRDKLEELGITSESYADVPSLEDYNVLDEEPPGKLNNWPPRWGITLNGPRGNMVIDHTPRDSEGDGKYHLRSKRGSDKSIAAFKTQREAIAGYLELKYIAGSPLRLVK